MDMLRDAIAQNGPSDPGARRPRSSASCSAPSVFATNFCAMGSLSDIHNFGDWRRFRAWILAGATALVGAQLLQAGGIVALDKSMYLASASINWAGHILGGLIFGFGMVFTGGCPSRNLARAGSGDLRSLLTLVVLGLFAYMAIGGVFGAGPGRARAGDELRSRRARASAASWPRRQAWPPATGSLLVAALLAAAALVYCFGNTSFRASAVHVFSGLAIGLIVVAGWALTGLAYDDMATKPGAADLAHLRAPDRATRCNGWCCSPPTPMPGFGTASVFGALVGAFAAALAMGRFRIATFSDTGDTLRNLAGAALMGLGGVMALGCTIGQGITGVSTLALGSFLSFAAIVAGGFWGLRVLERQIMASALTGVRPLGENDDRTRMQRVEARGLTPHPARDNMIVAVAASTG